MLFLDILHITAGVIIAIASVISLVPQLLVIVKRKGTTGLSYLTLLLGSLTSFSSMVNGVITNFNQLEICSSLGFVTCTSKILVILQLAGTWTVYTAILLCFIIFYSHKDQKQNWFWIRLISALYSVAMLVSVIVAALLVTLYHATDQPPLIYGTAWGYFASGLSFVQWLPQIYKTYKTKGRGNLSLTTIAIMAPGGAAVTFYLAVIAREHFSTWIAFFTAAIQLLVLLVMLLYYRGMERWRGEALGGKNVESEVDIDSLENSNSESSPFLSDNDNHSSTNSKYSTSDSV
eukprot:gb/GECH01000570.1/.p1 GENE.gb/GECH01000570.1/~~gb/GECH01000570.1/.p1  ORF type:complete len:290 (+),score=39.78 gb/GECH01000570.1/:1-870(+)